ncbi:MAG: helix-turn-helix domain-containing protein [Dehalococcoidia bacterium]
MKDLVVRRRNRLKHHYTLVSNVLLFGYRDLTDAEKLTYAAIDSFDWPDEKGERKGYAYPSVETLADRRGVDRRTVFRHMSSLESVGLLKREVRPGRPNLLWIEEPSEEESEKYLSTVSMGRDTDVTGGGDTDVTPYKKEEGEKNKTVNGEHSSLRRRKRLSAEQLAKREWLAGEMLKVLKDEHSLGFYRLVAATVPEHRVFGALSEVKLAIAERRIRTTSGALFVSLIRLHNGRSWDNLGAKRVRDQPR